MVRARWVVLLAGLIVAGIGATWGAGVFAVLSSGGFADPDSSSERVRLRIEQEFGPQNADVLALYSHPTLTVADPTFRAAVTNTLAQVKTRAEVRTVLSWYDTPAPTLVSQDRHATYVVIRLRGDTDSQRLDNYRAIKGTLVAGTPVVTQIGGGQPLFDDISSLSANDIQRAETLSMPVLLLLLIIIFASVVAGLTALLTGGLAILGALTVTRLLASVTEVSTFAVNIITLLGLGLSIDYGLLVVNRYREELAAGYPPGEAVARTVTTAGRTVAVSGTTVTLALASLIMFPQGFLKSMGYGGMTAVAVAMLAALTVLPAGLAVLGHRVNAGRLRWPGRTRRVPGVHAAPLERDGAWARLAYSVMRHPWWYLFGVLAILGVLATPVTKIEFGGLDVRVVPTSTQSRIVNDRIAAEFAQGNPYPINVLVTGVDRSGAAAVVDRLRRVPDVVNAEVAATTGSSVLVTLTYPGEANGDQARGVVAAVRALAPPPGTTIGVTGTTAALVDQLDGMAERLPMMAAFAITVTVLLLFAAFGSILLPLKAVLMNVVSLGAAFGAIVFVFQQGHFASLLDFTPTGSIEPTHPILMIGVLFGLATDYEVFLLSRIREEWDRGLDNTTAVANGLQHTGRIITAAGLLLVIVVIGFATGDIVFMKLIGVGMVVAIVVDATLVRALLVPATMRLLGRWNWWLPGPLRTPLPADRDPRVRAGRPGAAPGTASAARPRTHRIVNSRDPVDAPRSRSWRTCSMRPRGRPACGRTRNWPSSAATTCSCRTSPCCVDPQPARHTPTSGTWCCWPTRSATARNSARPVASAGTPTRAFRG